MPRIPTDSDRRRLRFALAATATLYGALAAAIAFVPARLPSGSSGGPPGTRRLPMQVSLTLGLADSGPGGGNGHPARPANAVSSASIGPHARGASAGPLGPTESSVPVVPGDVPASGQSAGDAGLDGMGAATGVGESGGVDSVGAGVGDPARAAFLTWLDGAIRSRLAYPERARRRHLSGAVDVAISVGADGTLLDARVARGSGSGILDADAVGLVRSAFPSPRPPGAAFTDTVRIHYLLERE